MEGTTAHAMVTLPEAFSFVLPMPVVLLEPLFTCTFQRLVCPAVEGAAVTGPATDTTSCTTSVVAIPLIVTDGLSVSP